MPPLPADVPDLPARTWFQYGYQEGISRLLDLWDEFGVKVTSHMVGSAVRRNPALARKIVQRGHEAAAHSRNWQPEFGMSREEEKAFIAAGVADIELQLSAPQPAHAGRAVETGIPLPHRRLEPR